MVAVCVWLLRSWSFSTVFWSVDATDGERQGDGGPLRLDSVAQRRPQDKGSLQYAQETRCGSLVIFIFTIEI